MIKDKIINFVNNNFTREEINEISKNNLKILETKFGRNNLKFINNKKVVFKNKNKGFAIGTILLAIALIATIGAALAIASKSTSSDTSTQNAKMSASGIINMGSQIKTTADKYNITHGVTPSNLTFNPYANGTETGLSGTLQNGGGRYGIFNTTEGMPYVSLSANSIASPFTAVDTSSAVCKSADLSTASSCNRGADSFSANSGFNNWYLGRITTNAGTDSIDEAIFLYDISPQACVEINKQTNKTNSMTVDGSTTAIPEVAVAYASGSVDFTNLSATSASNSANWGGEGVNYRAWTEGCFKNGAGGRYVYFNLIKIN